MDDWDDITAPQWSDFKTPKSQESFFDNQNDKTITNFTINPNHEKGPLTTLSSNELEFMSELDTVKMTPIRIVSPHKRNKENIIKETTYEDFLAKALNDINIHSASRHSTKQILKTPVKTDTSEDKYFTPTDKFLSPENVTKSLMKLIKAKHSSAKIELNFQDIDNEKTDNIHESKKQSLNSSQAAAIKEIVEPKIAPSRLVTDKFTLKDSKTSVAKLKTAKVLPYQNRRLSIKKLKKPDIKAQTKNQKLETNVQTKSQKSETKPQPKNQKPFVSMAEAMNKFQVGTPKRFRTTSTKENKANVLAKFASKQLTQAVSPALISKTRVRKTSTSSQSQKDKVPTQTSTAKISAEKNVKPDFTLKKIQKKPPTVPQPFNLSSMKKDNKSDEKSNKEITKKDEIEKKIEVQKKDNVQTDEDKQEKVPTIVKDNENKPLLKTLQSVAAFDLTEIKNVKTLNLDDIQKIEFKKFNPSNNGIKKVSSGKITRPKSFNGHGIHQKNTVPVVLGSDGKAITVQEKEVIHFGIKIGQPKALKLKSMPFSFDKRTKELQEKKQQKLKQLQEEEQKKKVEFHAKPVPTFKRSNSTPSLSNKDNFALRPKTTPQPFSFEERDKLLLKKREESRKQAQDIDKKNRIFHANPVPNFKPVPIAAASYLKNERKKEPVINKNRPLKAVHIVDKKEEVSSEKAKLKKTVPTMELHSDKRAKERKEFDEKLKEKQRAEEEQKQKQLEEQQMKQKEMDLMLRKQMEVKAKPMPEFKPVVAIKSNKPLTNPQSPAWTRTKNG